MPKFFGTLLILFLLHFSTSGQSVERARIYIDTLCSPYMHGRGAEFGGDSIAANYLNDRFKDFGLKGFSNNYLQYFRYDINTFPGDCFLDTDVKPLLAGEDFIANSFSEKGKGKAKIVHLDTNIFSSEELGEKFLKKNLKRKALVYHADDLPKLLELPQMYIQKVHSARAIIELESKLTAGLSRSQYSHPFFKVLTDSFPSEAKKIKFKLDAELVKAYQSQNIIGYIEGETKPDSFIVFSAHYDHLGRMGKNVYFPGANDNASGVSMLLELARYYSLPENKQDFSIVFMLFGAEEAGLIGSAYYTDHPLFPLKKIKFLINMDLLGTGEEGLMAVNGKILPAYFNRLTKLNDEQELLPVIKKRGEAANSDHYFFTERGVPAFFVYTMGGIQAYHDIYDIPATLPLTEFKDVFQLLTSFVTDLQQ